MAANKAVLARQRGNMKTRYCTVLQGCIFHGIHGPNCPEGIHDFPEEIHHFNSKLILRFEYLHFNQLLKQFLLNSTSRLYRSCE